MVQYLLNNEYRKESHLIWAVTRSVLEANNYKHKKSGKKTKSHWDKFESILQVLKLMLKMMNIYEKGIRKARQIKINTLEMKHQRLPKAFSGYRILHLSDLHLDALPGIEKKIIKKIHETKFDLCIITGDFRKDQEGGYDKIFTPLKKIIDTIHCPDGIYAVLGNHDTYLMKSLEDHMNIRFLINESVSISRKGSHIFLTGTDDPFAYYTEQAAVALQHPYSGFKIAAVHTPELKNLAADNHYNLYLCGHTHGGQICLPNGTPLITHQKEGREFAMGRWHVNGMTGYTSTGCGVSGLPVRYNCEGEITLIKLNNIECYENN